MIEIALVVIFVFGYLSITLEHTFKIDKLIPAVGMMALLWAIIALAIDSVPTWFSLEENGMLEGFTLLPHDSKLHLLEESLLHHLGKTAEILVFLMGAMTIVEITDHYNGFGAIKQFVKTKDKRVLLWIMAILAFILSAIIDNLTATIVLITILKKLVDKQEDRLWFAGLIVVAANAGGAWSPIGDVTTTMLWIGKKVSAVKLAEFLFLPSLICMIVPTFIASLLPAFKGELTTPNSSDDDQPASLGMLLLGLGMIVFVPLFKTVTHLPPYIGMMLSLAVVGSVAELKSARAFRMSDVSHHHSPVHASLARIEMPSILFFLGILMAVAALESVGMIFELGVSVRAAIPDDLFVILLGFGSAVIDNVPLVAASMGMFQLPMDHHIWHFIAFSAGTGGSMLIIGSAAGVVAMGMERINFMWYLKKIAWLALIGFAAGVATFMLLVQMLHGL